MISIIRYQFSLLIASFLSHSSSCLVSMGLIPLYREGVYDVLRSIWGGSSGDSFGGYGEYYDARTCKETRVLDGEISRCDLIMRVCIISFPPKVDLSEGIKVASPSTHPEYWGCADRCVHFWYRVFRPLQFSVTKKIASNWYYKGAENYPYMQANQPRCQKFNLF